MLNHNLRASSTKLEAASKKLEQKVAELKESEEKYRSLFEAANDAVFMVDRQGYISFANPEFFKVMGYRPQELEKLHFTHLVHPDDVSLVVDHHRRRLAGEDVETKCQFRALTKDKRVVYVDGNFSLVEKEGKVIGIQLIARDITQRKYLEKSLEKRTKELKALYDTTRQVATSLNLDEVLTTIAQSSANLLGVDGAIVRLLDAEHKILEVVKAHNLKTDSPGLTVMRLGEGVTSRIVLKGKPIAVEDVQQDPHYREKEWAKKEGFISFLGVPLESKKKIIGTLSFLSRRKRIFREEEISLVSIFADEAAVAIENAKLYEEQKKSLLERKKLHEISVASSSKLDTSSILRLIVESALELTGAKRATIRLLSRDKKKVEKALYASSDPEFSYPPAKLRPDRLAWRIIREKRPIVARVGSPTSSLIRDKSLKMGIKTLAGFPLIEQEDVVGALLVDSTSPHAFGEEQIRTVCLLSNQAAVVLKNARLFEENVKFSITDPLTGIYNSRYFYDSLRRDINRATRYGGTTSVIMFDLDGFKNYNDLYGHQAGDYVLREVAQRMLRYCRQTDILARYGGDEFVILLPQPDQGGGIKLGERIRLGLEEGLFAGKRGELRYKVTVSGSVITSPQDGDEVEDLMRKLDTLLYVAKWMGENRVYSSSTISLEFIQDQLLERVDQKDHYTRQHSERVANYATALARKMNLDKEQIELIRMASLVHDVGKVSIPEIVLNKPGKLNEEEWNLIRSHPRNSAEITRLSPLPREIISLILHHHERWNSTGYPQRLKGEEIPLGARIIGLADAYDAMSVERPYRGKLKPKEAIEGIKKLAGSQFDPTLVEVFVKAISPKS